MSSAQCSLLGHGEPAIDTGFAAITRRDLAGEAWFEYQADWVSGHEVLFQALASGTRWQAQQRQMYDRTVSVPRLVASLPADGPGHPLLAQMRSVLEARYRTDLPNVTMALYRDGNDSVAWHGDYVARELTAAVVATVSLGAPRRFLLRPRSPHSGVRRSLAMSLGWGDLIVMGGSCQRTWEHSIPKVKQADPRLVIMFRSAYGRGA